MKKRKKFIVITAILAIGLSAFGWWRHERQNERPYLTIMGYITAADGLGRQPIELIKTLKDDISINFIPTEKKIILKDVPADVAKIIKKKNKKMGRVVIFEDCVWIPGLNKYDKLKTPVNNDQIRIAYSMFESTKIPAEWVMIFNTYFDAIAVPDKFLVDVYKNSGVKIPIFELPLGLDFGQFCEAPLKEKKNEPFVFANFSTCIDRKNHILLINAFAKAFGNNPKVILRINARYGDEETLRTTTRELSVLNYDNIQFTQLTLEKNAYFEMFSGVDCYVSPSKAEGFSIQPREAMALGIPVIATNNTGQTTICETNLVRAVNSTIEKPALYFWNSYYGKSFDCTEEDLVEALLDVYNNYEKYLENASAARKWVRQYEFQELHGLYKTLVKPDKIKLGSENKITDECLIIAEKKLYEKYKNLTNCITE